ncbi:helix-turn-helix transcriptional regulator [Alteromonas australica]|uniref:helix-turn-helix transcriptional regulator n=1 Tax=Alteromonas australica TaxID=589873 RepID=UPI003F67EF9D|tara:strand:- start:878 stop:1243 length:366 start_codon:yes stop_codon:yes gene_type:complete
MNIDTRQTQSRTSSGIDNPIVPLIESVSSDSANQYRVVRLRDAARLMGKGVSTIWKEVKEGLCIPPFSISPKVSGYLETEVKVMIASRAAGLTQEQRVELVSKLLAHRVTQAQNIIYAFTE